MGCGISQQSLLKRMIGANGGGLNAQGCAEALTQIKNHIGTARQLNELGLIKKIPDHSGHKTEREGDKSRQKAPVAKEAGQFKKHYARPCCTDDDNQAQAQTPE